MALSRRTGTRFQSSIWPGFVDAMTGLLLVLMFVLTIFMIVQFVLTERITGQESELDALAGEVAALAQALGLEERETAQLEARLGALNASLTAAQDRVADQAGQIATLTAQRDQTAVALAGAQAALANTEASLAAAQNQITAFEAQVAGLLSDRDAALGQVADLEARETELLDAQAALNLALATARDEVDAQAEAARLAAARREALDALIADLRARNAASQSEVADLQDTVASQTAELDTQADRIAAQAAELDSQAEALSAEEAARLAEAAAAEALRARLQDADAELTAMTLALEQQRQEAEDTLTLLAAARAAEGDLDARLTTALLALQEAETAAELAAQRADVQAALAAEQDDAAAALREAQAQLEGRLAEVEAANAGLQAEIAALRGDTESTAADREALRAQLAEALAAKLAAQALAEDTTTEAQKRAALLAEAQQALAVEEAISAEAQRQTELLNQQVAALRGQLGELQALLDDAQARDAAREIELQSLGQDLNTALARVAAEERRRAELEAAERARLEEEAKALEAQALDLEQYRSEFFGRLRDLLGTQEGVRIEGDRFVFSSEVLFPPGGAELSFEGQAEVAKVAGILRSIADEIPPEIDWVLRVDGHTDNVPLSGLGEFADNWELSQARALSVVKYMISDLGIAPDRLAANGFGQFQPVDLADTDEARARNRRIELKFTEK